MRMRIIGTLVLFCALVAAGATVMTVTNGQPDGNAHPYVGVMLQAAPGGGSSCAPAPRCRQPRF